MGCRNNDGPRSVMVLNLGAVILRSSKPKKKSRRNLRLCPLQRVEQRIYLWLCLSL